MSIGPGGGAASELDAIRLEYESSLSWRVTRPLRALGRGARTLRPAAPERRAVEPPPGRYDAWLADERLARLDAVCAGGAPEHFARFRELETDLWALLLTQEYNAHPHIRALLPDVPDPSLQELWNGASGARWPPRARRSTNAFGSAAAARWPARGSSTSAAAGAG